MLTMEDIYTIKYLYKVKNLSIRKIAKQCNISRNTLSKLIANDFNSRSYVRDKSNNLVINEYANKIVQLIKENEGSYARLTNQRIFDIISREGYIGSYDTINNFVNNYKELHKHNVAYVPLEFAIGDAAQFDWGYEFVYLNGNKIRIKVARVTLCYSRFTFVIAYPNETLEMVLDAHNEALAFFNGIPKRIIYDNMKTVVTKVLVGKDRIINRKYLEMASHYLFAHTLCTPAAGWENGRVESKIRSTRENLFVPLLHANSFAELNSTLLEMSIQYAKTHKHYEFKDKSVYNVFQEEQSYLQVFIDKYDSFRVLSVVVNKVSQILFETNLYSVPCEYVGKSMTLHIKPWKIDIYDNSMLIVSHVRCFEKHQIISVALHYIKVLLTKPGALRDGSPFKDLNKYLPPIYQIIRDKLGQSHESDREYAKILQFVLEYNVNALTKACEKALDLNMISADIIQYYLTCTNDQIDYKTFMNVENDCSYYSQLYLDEVQ